MFKQLLFIALIAIALAKVHKADDPFTACLKTNCKTQFFNCQSDSQCLPTIKRCSESIDPSNKKGGLACFQSNDKSWALFQCAHSSCSSGRAEEVLPQKTVSGLN